MKDMLAADWQELLKDEFPKSYFQALSTAITEAYGSGKTILPMQAEIFKTFNKCSVDSVKVVLIGQDPYPTAGHANGLCFSLNSDVKPLARSLINIFKEIENDLNVPMPNNGDLTRWAEQGVLMLNAILTVEEGKPQSHKGLGWEKFTDAVVAKIAASKENVVFILWGAYAHKKGKGIDRTKHFVLESGHPSPLSANQGKWFGNKHFSKTNAYLLANKQTPIKW